MKRILLLAGILLGLTGLFIGYTGSGRPDRLWLAGSAGLFIAYVSAFTWAAWELREIRSRDFVLTGLGILTVVGYLPFQSFVSAALRPDVFRDGDLHSSTLEGAFYIVPAIVAGVSIALAIRRIADAKNA